MLVANSRIVDCPWVMLDKSRTHFWIAILDSIDLPILLIDSANEPISSSGKVTLLVEKWPFLNLLDK